MNQVVSAILQRDVTQPKILYTQLPNFRGSNKFNEYQHHQLSHLQPHPNKITDEDILHFLQCLLKNKATDLWQTLRIISETTFRDVLMQFKQEVACEEIKENYNNKWS